MLVISDAPARSETIFRALRQIEPCELVALHEADAVRSSHLMIACHLSESNDTTKALLTTALKKHRFCRQVPLLFFVPIECEALCAFAKDCGADEIVGDHLDAISTRQAARAARANVRGSNRPKQLVAQSENRELARAGQSLILIFEAVRTGTKISESVLSNGAEALTDMVSRQTMKDWIDIVRGYDNLTYQHCLLVSCLVATFAKSLFLGVSYKHALAKAALLHDVGKVHVPIAILNKVGALTAAEREIVERHPLTGYELLARQNFRDRQCLDVVRHHHEFLDGSGYPDRLVGTQISEQVRITTICDIFSALIERRPYRTQQSPHEAYTNLTGLVAKLDKGLLKDFRVVAGSAI